jgi:hypothetical protein
VPTHSGLGWATTRRSTNARLWLPKNSVAGLGLGTGLSSSVAMWLQRSYTLHMRKDAVYRMRVPSRTLAAIKKVAAARGEDASEWGRAIIEAELRRDLAAIQLRDQLRAARPGGVSEENAMDLALEAQRAARAR